MVNLDLASDSLHDGFSAGDLRDRGWAALNLEVQDEASYASKLSRLAEQLGEPVRLPNMAASVTALRPTPAATARPRSLSRQFSLGEFPFHVDTAHWLTPCRYVIMGCLCPGAARRPSLLLDINSLALTPAQTELLEQAPLKIRNGRHSFFGTVPQSGGVDSKL